MFDDIAQAPGSAVTLRANDLLFNLGAGADYLVTRASGARAGVVLGVRAGVAVAPNRSTWTREGQRVDAGPDVGPGGPFARVHVGLGWR
jgi:hypothetical protein